jgi:hypothetical protein
MLLHSVGDHLVETGALSCADDGNCEAESAAPAVGFDDALKLIRGADRPVTLRFIADR